MSKTLPKKCKHMALLLSTALVLSVLFTIPMAASSEEDSGTAAIDTVADISASDSETDVSLTENGPSKNEIITSMVCVVIILFALGVTVLHLAGKKKK